MAWRSSGSTNAEMVSSLKRKIWNARVQLCVLGDDANSELFGDWMVASSSVRVCVLSMSCFLIAFARASLSPRSVDYHSSSSLRSSLFIYLFFLSPGGIHLFRFVIVNMRQAFK
jgi:hypothetical protein